MLSSTELNYRLVNMKKYLIIIAGSLFLFGCGTVEDTKPDLSARISAAIQEEEFRRKIAERQAIQIAEEMQKYGLSYSNEEARIQFLIQRKEKGELDLKNELALARERNKMLKGTQ